MSGNFAISQHFSEFTADGNKVAVFALLFMSATAYVVSRGVSGGIEAAARLLMPCLLVVMLLITLYGLTLPNASAGIAFYLQPDFSQLSAGVIYSALGQAFFSLSLGMGTLLTLGSYLSKEANITSSSAMITLADLSIAFLAGMLIFPLVFSQGLGTGGGETLIFEALPAAFASFGDVLGPVIGGGFFLLLAFAALTSTVSMLEVPTAWLMEEFSLSRKQGAWLAAVAIFVVSIPSLLSAGAVSWLTEFLQFGPGKEYVSFMSFVGMLTNDTLLPVSGFCIAVFAAWVWRTHNLNQEKTCLYRQC